MFGDVVQEVVDVLKGQVLEEIKGEIYANGIKQSATFIFLALRNERDDEGKETGESPESCVERAVQIALDINAAVDHRLGIEG